MKKILMAAVALTALTATPAMAADVDTTFAVSGVVTGKCTIATGAAFSINGSAGVSTDSSGALSGTNSGTSQPVAVSCNSAGSKIVVTHSAMVNSAYTADANGYTKTIDFVPKATIGTTDYAEGAERDLGIVAGNLTVTASSLSTASNARPYAGTFTGSITVTLKPGA